MIGQPITGRSGLGADSVETTVLMIEGGGPGGGAADVDLPGYRAPIPRDFAVAYDGESKTRGRDMVKCGVCGTRVPADGLLNHDNTAHAKADFQCQQRSYRGRSSRDLRNHSRDMQRRASRVFTLDSETLEARILARDRAVRGSTTVGTSQPASTATHTCGQETRHLDLHATRRS